MMLCTTLTSNIIFLECKEWILNLKKLLTSIKLAQPSNRESSRNCEIFRWRWMHHVSFIFRFMMLGPNLRIHWLWGDLGHEKSKCNKKEGYSWYGNFPCSLAILYKRLVAFSRLFFQAWILKHSWSKICWYKVKDHFHNGEPLLPCKNYPKLSSYSKFYDNKQFMEWVGRPMTS